MRIVLHRTFEKQIKKLPSKIQATYKIRRDVFLEDPFHPLLDNHSVDRAFPGCRSINITGDYRVIFKAQDGIAHFLKIGSHSELYS